jgi:uncharacterized membrane protein
MNLHPVLLFLHLVSVVVWVGGMFFAYVCLRPTAAELFQPPQRLQLWRGVFARFFVWVWGAVALIAVSGFTMLGLSGFAAALPGTHMMLASGLLMIAIYVYVASVPYPALQRAVAAEDWKAGGAALNRIRQMVGTNLLLGLLTLGFASLGRYLA